MPSSSPFLTTRQVAELFGVTTRTIRRSVEAGTLAPIRLSKRGRLRFRRSDVEALLGCGTSTSEAVESATSAEASASGPTGADASVLGTPA